MPLATRISICSVTAIDVDAAGALFPLAYAVVNVENDDNWLWFIRQLHQIIEAHAATYLVPGVLTILSDRQKGLIEGVETVFPHSPHGYCLRHLWDNMHKEFKEQKSPRTPLESRMCTHHQQL